MHTGIGLWIGHRKAVIVDIETADKMTDRQVARSQRWYCSLRAA
jgi:hypothetical protein